MDTAQLVPAPRPTLPRIVRRDVVRQDVAPSKVAPVDAPRRLFLKRTLDIAVSLTLLVVASPLVLLAALLVKLTSRGPVLYSQLRVGQQGKLFRLYKLRSMRTDSESLTGAQWSTPGDTRVTRIGRILRKTHLDELPQLWSILRGDMSLVGPRPERPEFVVHLEKIFPLYRERLRVKPGLTGLAQVQLEADSDLVSVRDKLACDLHYVRKGGLWLDLRILAGTAFHVVGLPFRMWNAMLRLPSGNRFREEYRGAVMMDSTPHRRMRLRVRVMPHGTPDVAAREESTKPQAALHAPW